MSEKPPAIEKEKVEWIKLGVANVNGEEVEIVLPKKISNDVQAGVMAILRVQSGIHQQDKSKGIETGTTAIEVELLRGVMSKLNPFFSESQSYKIVDGLQALLSAGVEIIPGKEAEKPVTAKN